MQQPEGRPTRRLLLTSFSGCQAWPADPYPAPPRRRRRPSAPRSPAAAPPRAPRPPVSTRGRSRAAPRSCSRSRRAPVAPRESVSALRRGKGARRAQCGLGREVETDLVHELFALLLEKREGSGAEGNDTTVSNRAETRVRASRQPRRADARGGRGRAWSPSPSSASSTASPIIWRERREVAGSGGAGVSLFGACSKRRARAP